MNNNNAAAALERMFDAIDRVEALCAKSNKLDRERLLGRVMVNSADELSALRAALLSRESMTNIVIGATRHYGGEAWFRELTVAGVTFLAPLDEQEKARGILSALTSQPSGEAVAWPTEAKPAIDGDGWVALTGIAEHRMSKDQARVWNGCRAACLSAYNRTHPSADAPGVAVDAVMVGRFKLACRALMGLRGQRPTVYAEDVETMADVLRVLEAVATLPEVNEAMLSRAYSAWANAKVADPTDTRTRLWFALTAALSPAKENGRE